MKFIDAEIHPNCFRVKLFGVELCIVGIIGMLTCGPFFYFCKVGKLYSFDWGKSD